MALSHDEKMLDRPWLARHAMARHARDFEAFRTKFLRSLQVKTLLAEARQLRDAGKDASAVIEKLEVAKAVGDVDPIVTAPTHVRLNSRPSPNSIDEVLVMRAMRDDRIRRDLLMTFRQQTRIYSYGAIVVALLIASSGLGWAWDNTESIRATYQAAIIDYQAAQPKSLRQKASELLSFSKRVAAEKKQQVLDKIEERRQSNEQKQADVIDDIRRRRGE